MDILKVKSQPLLKKNQNKKQIFHLFLSLKKQEENIQVFNFLFQAIIKKLLQKKIDTKIIDLVPKKEDYKEHKLYSLLSDKLGIDDSFIQDIFKKYDDKRIESNVNYILKDKSEIKNIGAYLRSALSHDYVNQKSLFDVKKESKIELEDIEKKQANNEEIVVKLLFSYSELKTNKTIEFIKNNIEQARASIPDFIAKNKTNLLFNKLDIDNIDDVKKAINTTKTVGGIYRSFIYDKFLKDEMISFKIFANDKGFKVEEIAGVWRII